jgi:peptide deformylase
VSVLKIADVGNPVLRARAEEVLPEELPSDEVQRLIDDLIETRRAAGGAGLAANQVSALNRIAVVEVDDAARRRYPYKPPFPRIVIVNPVIEPLSDETLLVNEGCLSVPGLRGDVPRHTRIRVHYLDRNGDPNEVVVEGLTAGTFQHEVDHLDGVLFLDRVSDPRSFSTWEEFERHGRDAFLERVRPWVFEATPS